MATFRLLCYKIISSMTVLLRETPFLRACGGKTLRKSLSSRIHNLACLISWKKLPIIIHYCSYKHIGAKFSGLHREFGWFSNQTLRGAANRGKPNAKVLNMPRSALFHANTGKFMVDVDFHKL